MPLHAKFIRTVIVEEYKAGNRVCSKHVSKHGFKFTENSLFLRFQSTVLLTDYACYDQKSIWLPPYVLQDYISVFSYDGHVCTFHKWVSEKCKTKLLAFEQAFFECETRLSVTFFSPAEKLTSFAHCSAFASLFALWASLELSV